MNAEWKAISAHIHALKEAAELQAAYLAVNTRDTFETSEYLKGKAGSILTDVTDLSKRYSNRLPPGADQAIEHLIRENFEHNQREAVQREESKERCWASIIRLVAFEAEMTFLMSDREDEIRVRSDRAFAHLQRSIVADADFRKKWQDAFAVHETKCEKLGAVHLLLHGIWAFKGASAGGQTDLVFVDIPAPTSDDPTRYADGLVLTEWKLSRPGENADAIFLEARKQAARYKRAGVVGTLELVRYRYAVVVSENYVPVPADVRVDEVTYRHIGIAVDPSSVSKSNA